MPRKRKKLVEDFEELLEAGDMDALKAVYDTCALDAVFGYSKDTALALRGTPPELMRWLIDQGIDVNTENRFSKTALAEHANRGDVDRMTVLLECGADIEAGKYPPLFMAAKSHQPKAIALLLENGADLHSECRLGHGRTAFKEAIATADTDAVRRVLESIDVLLDAGSVIDDEVREEFTKFGRRYNRMSDKAREVYQPAMDRLYERIGADRPEVITPHDGHSDIIVSADKSTNGQFKYLWNYLVPGGGAAATVQGEVIRIVGRLGYEALEMGYVNWDEDFVQMTDFWLETVGAAEEAMTVVKQRKAGEADIDALTEAAVAWVADHPQPITLGEVPYRR
ncbi:ankyrin repeat domain-containing protein [Corynebacterium sp. HMSC064E08]|uniref:ankyrin repeat domain-containing protein n=1 Tax=Corynebacterium sp. HMSC064E08 TaxID=1739324 RepID=UPI0008A1F9F2|nr:ankyrin repeat domain-containing protein [Corynebacterium sp. HMSC064E08]OFK32602.1 ankryin [Corynebacterium sp. HMSC064E08]